MSLTVSEELDQLRQQLEELIPELLRLDSELCRMDKERACVSRQFTEVWKKKSIAQRRIIELEGRVKICKPATATTAQLAERTAKAKKATKALLEQLKPEQLAMLRTLLAAGKKED